jgi:mono/diheme cytochrome c family protein
MNQAKWAGVVGVTVMVIAGVVSSSQPVSRADDTPAPTFGKDVKTFLQTYCINCHGAAKPRAGINLESYDSTVNGGKSLVVAGKPDDSRLVRVCEGKGKPMPPKKAKQPSADEIKSLRDWIADGAKNN